MSVIRSYFFCFLAIDNDIMRKMCTLITSKGTDIDENIANQNHATRTRKPGYLNLSNHDLFTHVRLLNERHIRGDICSQVLLRCPNKF